MDASFANPGSLHRHLLVGLFRGKGCLCCKMNLRFVAAPRPNRSVAKCNACFNVSEEEISRYPTGMIHGIDFLCFLLFSWPSRLLIGWFCPNIPRASIQQVFWQMRCIFISPKGAAIQKFYRYDIRHGFLVLLNALVTVAAFCTCVACHLPRIAASCRMRDFCQMRHVKCNLIAKGDQPLRYIYQRCCNLWFDSNLEWVWLAHWSIAFHNVVLSFQLAFEWHVCVYCKPRSYPTIRHLDFDEIQWFSSL